jgi:hypothetical protein
MAVPAGTRVVLRVEVPTSDAVLAVGSVAVVVGTSHDAARPFRVQSPNGQEAWVERDAFALLSEVKGLAQAEVAAGSPLLDEKGLGRHVIYRCVVGSRAYGLDTPESDVDLRGIYQAPTALVLSLQEPPEQLEDLGTEECYWELKKFLVLALKANPNVLEVLWSPLVLHATPVAQELLAMRGKLLSRLVYATFNGYSIAQFNKMRRSMDVKGKPNWKHAMHLVRLLESGIAILETGEIDLRARHRAELLEIRAGVWPWERVDRWRRELHERFERALATTRLPERPDYAAANAFLVGARKRGWEACP